jgi:hypothetical protein
VILFLQYYWNSQVSRNCNGSLDLLDQIVGVDRSKGFLGGVIEGIAFLLFALVILDLDGSSDAHLTEGAFIPSGAAGDNPGG